METTAAQVLSALGYPDAGVCIAVVDGKEIVHLHQLWFEDSAMTNVISLEYPDTGHANELVGEIYICWEEAVREAEIAEQPALYRSNYLLMHGLLHICGYEHVNVDDEERHRMEQKEEELERRILLPLFWERGYVQSC